jgi:hypothetical protein
VKNNRNAGGKQPVALADKYPREYDCVAAINDAIARLKELGYVRHYGFDVFKHPPAPSRKLLLLDMLTEPPARLAKENLPGDVVVMHHTGPLVSTRPTKEDPQ